MAANIRCIMRAKAPYGQGITKMKVKLTPEQSSTPSLMPETESVYLRRATEGTGELMELVGGTVAWNQLFKAAGASTINGIAYSRSEDLSIQTMNGTASANSYRSLPDIPSTVVNHIYYVSQEYAISGVQIYNDSAGVSTQGDKETIGKATAVTGWFIRVASGTTLDNVSIRPLITDLTLMLGPAIANYVYSLEQATAGSGIAWLKSYGFFEDYVAYSAPTLQSVEATSHVTKDANNTIIATYPLDSITLRGIPKLTNGVLSYDGDTYEWDGTVTRKWAEVDLGTLSWNRNATNEYFTAVISGMNNTTSDRLSGLICDKYAMSQTSGLTTDSPQEKTMMRYAGQIVIKDSSYTDAASFKTAMNGVKLVYELATPTTESAEPFTAVQTVEAGGTEEFVTTNNVPVGVVGRFANAVPMEGVDSFTVTANDGTVHTYPVTLSEEIYRGYVDMLTGEAISDMASIAEYNGETIGEPWLSSLDEYATGTTPTYGAQVVYPITPEEVTATITGDPSTLSGVVSATSTEGTVEWSELSEIGIKCIMKRKNPFQ